MVGGYKSRNCSQNLLLFSIRKMLLAFFFQFCSVIKLNASYVRWVLRLLPAQVASELEDEHLIPTQQFPVFPKCQCVPAPPSPTVCRFFLSSFQRLSIATDVDKVRSVCQNPGASSFSYSASFSYQKTVRKQANRYQPGFFTADAASTVDM